MRLNLNNTLAFLLTLAAAFLPSLPAWPQGNPALDGVTCQALPDGLAKKEHQQTITRLAISNDGTQVVASNSAGQFIQTKDGKMRELIQILNPKRGTSWDYVTILPNGIAVIIVKAFDGPGCTVMTYDSNGKGGWATPLPHEDLGATVNAAGTRLWVSDSQSKVWMIDLKDGRIINSKNVAEHIGDKKIYIINLVRGEQELLVQGIAMNVDNISQLRLKTDSLNYINGSSLSNAKLYGQVSDAKDKGTLVSYNWPARVTWQADGSIIKEEEVRPTFGHLHQAISASSHQMAFSGYEGNLAVHSATTMKDLWKTKVDQKVSTMAFSQNGKYLAVGCVGGEILVYEATSGKPVNHIKPNFKAAL